MKNKILCFIFSCMAVNAFTQSYYGSFSVGGTSANYYPVLFSVSGVDGISSLGKLSVYIDNVHANGSWSGAFHSDIEFISCNYGHMSTKIVEFTYVTGNGSPYNDPIGDIVDGSTSGGGSQMVIWLKGGATYQWSTTLNSRVTLIDGNSAGSGKTSASGNTLNSIASQSQLVTMAKNNTYLPSVGFGTAGNGYFGGNVGIGTTSPLGSLHIEASENNQYGHLIVNRSNYGAVGGQFSINNWGGGTNASAVLAFGLDNCTNFNGVGNNNSNAEIRAVNRNGSNNATDLLFSNWSGSIENINMSITSNGNIGIGTTSPSEKLSVNGNIRSKRLIVTQNGWSDYVFDSTYRLKPLIEVEQFITTNKHLPDIPSTKEVNNKGIDVGENQALLLKKIEELTLYIIEMKKGNDAMKEDATAMKKEIQALQKENAQQKIAIQQLQSK